MYNDPKPYLLTPAQAALLQDLLHDTYVDKLRHNEVPPSQFSFGDTVEEELAAARELEAILGS